MPKKHTFLMIFASVFTVDDGHIPDLPSRVTNSTSKTSVTFTPSIVRNTLRKLKPSTSAGLHGISNVFLKNCDLSLCLPLCHIFDTSFKTNRIPEQWLNAVVVPIHKKGVTNDPNNYRPISLTSTCCRVMERIINNEILDYLLKNSLITMHQHGFIKRKSTCTNLLECLNDWNF
jgi:Reverse transcriptase (RNA-dependent DNA polymerase)